MKRSRLLSLFGCIAALQGCAVHNPDVFSAPKLQKPSASGQKLAELPLPGQRIAVAVYNFSDQTGQFKPTDNVQTLSRAVTQGATSILIDALHQAADRKWFTVIERERLDNVLRERAVIREMRSSYLGEKTVNPQALPPLLFAGILLEGGIIGYDANTKTGGLGARFLGIGGHVQYREDTITLYLRAVSVKTGEVLSTVSVRKSIASVSAGADAFRYVAFKELLEAESGFAYNEPDQLALRTAIQEAVYSLVIEGTANGLWCLDTTGEKAEQMVRKYLADRGSIAEADVKLPLGNDGRTANFSCGKSTAAPRPASPRSENTPAQVPQIMPQAASPPQLAVVPREANEGGPAAPTVAAVAKPASPRIEIVSDPEAITFVSDAVVQPTKAAEPARGKASPKGSKASRVALVPQSVPVRLPNPQFGREHALVSAQDPVSHSASRQSVDQVTAGTTNKGDRRPSRALLAQLASVP
jgi:curli production assembly/transport component CsgG